MEGTLRAIEIGGTIDEKHQLHLDRPIPIDGPSRVRVIILVPESAEIDEQEWLQAAAHNPAFDFLNEPAEDIYSFTDGKPFAGLLARRQSLSAEIESLRNSMEPLEEDIKDVIRRQRAGDIR
jgi:hypothetical protein